MDLQTIYSEFQILETSEKIEYLKKNQNYLESNFNVNIPNLIKSWEIVLYDYNPHKYKIYGNLKKKKCKKVKKVVYNSWKIVYNSYIRYF